MASTLPLHRLYYTHGSQTRLATSILRCGEDEDGFYVIPLQTIFHPKGGGQPSDEGKIFIGETSFEVTHLSSDAEGYVKHYLPKSASSLFPEGAPIVLQLHEEKRKIHMHYHSGGHLIDYILFKEYPNWAPYKGNHYPDQASVTYRLKGREADLPQKEDFAIYDPVGVSRYLVKESERLIAAGLPLKTTYHQGWRRIQLGDEAPCNCGGTHVENMSALGGIRIKKVKFKKKEGFKISYEMIFPL